MQKRAVSQNSSRLDAEETHRGLHTLKLKFNNFIEYFKKGSKEVSLFEIFLQKIFNSSSHKKAAKTTFELFKPPLTVRIFLVSFIMFALCFGYYGLWMWLPELFKRMTLYGGSPCSNHLNKTIVINETVSCHIENSVYMSSFYSSLSNLPGNIFTILFIDKMGRNVITSVSLICSGLSVFGIPFIYNEDQGVILTT